MTHISYDTARFFVEKRQKQNYEEQHNVSY